MKLLTQITIEELTPEEVQEEQGVTPIKLADMPEAIPCLVVSSDGTLAVKARIGSQSADVLCSVKNPIFDFSSDGLDRFVVHSRCDGQPLPRQDQVPP